MLENIAGRTALIGAIERARNSTVLTYVLHDGAQIAEDALPQIYDKLESVGHRERIDLFLVGRGGFTEACWRLVTLLREYCDQLGVLVPHRAHGGATLIALGANEIVMGPMSELSSIAPARVHPLLPEGPGGVAIPVGGDLPAALALLARHSPGGVLDASTLTALLAAVHPLALGALDEARALARRVATGALALHLDAETDAARIAHIVDTLDTGLHSPAYPLARREAAAVGLPVVAATGRLAHDLWALYGLYGQTLYRDLPEPAQAGAHFRFMALIETNGRTSGLRQTFIPQNDGSERVTALRWDTAVRSNTPGPPAGPDSLRRN